MSPRLAVQLSEAVLYKRSKQRAGEIVLWQNGCLACVLKKKKEDKKRKKRRKPGLIPPPLAVLA